MFDLFLERIFFLKSNHFSLFHYRRYIQVMTRNKAKQTKDLSGHFNFSALVPLVPGQHKFFMCFFDFSPVCVIKCSCAALITHNCEFSVHKYNQSSKDRQIVLRVLYVVRQVLRVAKPVLRVVKQKLRVTRRTVQVLRVTKRVLRLKLPSTKPSLMSDFEIRVFFLKTTLRKFAMITFLCTFK